MAAAFVIWRGGVTALVDAFILLCICIIGIILQERSAHDGIRPYKQWKIC